MTEPRKILVTGARGFVGRHLLPALAAQCPDTDLVRSGADLLDAAAVEAEVRRVRPAGCVHLAGVAAPTAARANPEHAWRVNLGGTLALAHAILAHAPECLLVFASSADAYGGSFRAGMALDEEAPLAPLNAYAATKAAADLALGALVPEGLRCVRVRAFNHTGPGQAPAFAVPAFARQAARIAAGRQPPVLQVGNLEPRRDFLDVRDVCTAYALCLAHGDALPPGAILNIASGEPRRIGDVLDAVLREAGIEARVEASADRLRPSDVPVARGDAGLARRLLGWTPMIPWAETLRSVVADWRERVAAGE